MEMSSNIESLSSFERSTQELLFCMVAPLTHCRQSSVLGPVHPAQWLAHCLHTYVPSAEQMEEKTLDVYDVPIYKDEEDTVGRPKIKK
jgi:hypothetical protein